MPLFLFELRARACLVTPLVGYAIRLAGETTWPTQFTPLPVGGRRQNRTKEIPLSRPARPRSSGFHDDRDHRHRDYDARGEGPKRLRRLRPRRHPRCSDGIRKSAYVRRMASTRRNCASWPPGVKHTHLSVARCALGHRLRSILPLFEMWMERRQDFVR